LFSMAILFSSKATFLSYSMRRICFSMAGTSMVPTIGRGACGGRNWGAAEATTTVNVAVAFGLLAPSSAAAEAGCLAAAVLGATDGAAIPPVAFGRGAMNRFRTTEGFAAAAEAGFELAQRGDERR
jgi:hypothetical protein